MMVIGAACGKDASLGDQCRDDAAGEDDAIAEQCKCDVAAGDYPDQASCVAEYATPEGYADCLCSAYDKHPEAKSGYDCGRSAGDKYQACFKAAACDEVKQGQCLDGLITDSQACPKPPEGLVEDLMGCDPEP